MKTNVLLQFKNWSGKIFQTLTVRLKINERHGFEYKRNTDDLKIWTLQFLSLNNLLAKILHKEKPYHILNSSTTSVILLCQDSFFKFV